MSATAESPTSPPTPADASALHERLQDKAALDAQLKPLNPSTSIREKPTAQEKAANRPTLQILAPVLDAVFGQLNHMTINVDRSLSEPFKIIVSEQGKENFPRRLFLTPNTSTTTATFTETGPASLNVFELQVKISPDFNVLRDLPGLIAGVEKAHNQQMTKYSNSEPMVFINTSAQLADYWQFFAQKLSEFASLHQGQLLNIKDQAAPEDQQNLGEQFILPSLQAYGELCRLIAQGFKQAASDQTTLAEQAENIDSTAVFSHAWQATEEKLGKILEKLALKKATNTRSITQIWSLAATVIGNRAQEEILDTLHTQARSAFFQHAKAELFRKAGLGELFERPPKTEQNDPAEVMLHNEEIVTSGLGEEHPYIEWLREEFPAEQKQLENLKVAIQAQKDNLNQTIDTNNQAILKEVLSQLQIRLAHQLCALVYSGKFFAYKTDNYSFADATDHNFVNCMVRGELLHQFWQTYAGENSFGVIKVEHYFLVVKTASNLLLSLDGVPDEIDFNIKEKNYLQIGLHEQLFILGIVLYKCREYELDSTKHHLAELLYKEAIRLAPNNPIFKVNFASMLAKYPERHQEAEKLYREAINLDPDNIKIKYMLYFLLIENPDREDDSDKLYKEIESDWS